MSIFGKLAIAKGMSRKVDDDLDEASGHAAEDPIDVQKITADLKAAKADLDDALAEIEEIYNDTGFLFYKEAYRNTPAPKGYADFEAFGKVIENKSIMPIDKQNKYLHDTEQDFKARLQRNNGSRVVEINNTIEVGEKSVQLLLASMQQLNSPTRPGQFGQNIKSLFQSMREKYADVGDPVLQMFLTLDEDIDLLIAHVFETGDTYQAVYSRIIMTIHDMFGEIKVASKDLSDKNIELKKLKSDIAINNAAAENARKVKGLAETDLTVKKKELIDIETKLNAATADHDRKVLRLAELNALIPAKEERLKGLQTDEANLLASAKGLRDQIIEFGNLISRSKTELKKTPGAPAPKQPDIQEDSNTLGLDMSDPPSGKGQDTKLPTVNNDANTISAKSRASSGKKRETNTMTVACPKCGHIIEHDKTTSRHIKCSRCKKSFTIPKEPNG